MTMLADFPFSLVLLAESSVMKVGLGFAGWLTIAYRTRQSSQSIARIPYLTRPKIAELGISSVRLCFWFPWSNRYLVRLTTASTGNNSENYGDIP